MILKKNLKNIDFQNSLKMTKILEEIKENIQNDSKARV